MRWSRAKTLSRRTQPRCRIWISHSTGLRGRAEVFWIFFDAKQFFLARSMFIHLRQEKIAYRRKILQKTRPSAPYRFFAAQKHGEPENPPKSSSPRVAGMRSFAQRKNGLNSWFEN